MAPPRSVPARRGSRPNFLAARQKVNGQPVVRLGGQRGFRGIQRGQRGTQVGQRGTRRGQRGSQGSLQPDINPGKHRAWVTWDLNIAVWNVEEKGSPQDIEKAIQKSFKTLPDIVCLQEVKFDPNSFVEKLATDTEKTEEKLETGSDKTEEKLVTGSDETEEKLVTGSDKTEEKLVTGSDKTEGKLLTDSEKTGEKLVSISVKTDEKRSNDSDKLENLANGSDKADKKCLRGTVETEHFNWFCQEGQGSAVLINKALAGVEVVACQAICEQIYMVELKNDNRHVKVISCCVPPSSNYVNTKVWENLTNLLKSIPSSANYVLAGDFNAEVGKKDAIKVVCGGFGPLTIHNDSNENGLKLIDLVRTACLRVSNTFKPLLMLRPIKHYNYRDGENKAQRSYILVPKNGNSVSKHNFFNHWHPGYNHALLQNHIKIIKSDKYSFGLVENNSLGKNKMLISTWNVQGSSPAKVDTLLNEQKLQLVCVQDLFLTSADDLNTEHYDWFSPGKLWAKNVALVVKKSADIKIDNFEVVSDTLCYGDVTSDGNKVRVISCYLPPPKDPRHEAAKSQLEELVKAIPKETLFVVGGDLNTYLSEVDSEDNSKFVESLVEQCELCLEHTLYQDWIKYKGYLNTKVTASGVSRPQQFLLPRLHRLQRHTKLFTRWIPFYENAILCLYFADLDVQPTGRIMNTKYTLKMESADGKFRKIRELDCFEPDELNEENLISEEDREKFKSTSPSAEELGRMFKDFVIFYKTVTKKDPNPLRKESVGTTGVYDILVDSFRAAGKFGKFLVEEVENISLSDQSTLNGECRIKWQGIVLEEVSGQLSDSSLKIMKTCAENLISKLGQTCHTVKAKRMFFNRGFEPAMPKNEELDKIFRMVTKKDYPSMEVVTAYIKTFFSSDTECELAFGRDFTSDELAAVKQYAQELGLESRTFTLAREPKVGDHVAIFKHRTPQEIRDTIISVGDHPKYCLVPPSGLGVDYKEFAMKFDKKSEVLKKDFKEYNHFWSTLGKERQAVKDAAAAKSTPQAGVGQEKPAVKPKKTAVQHLNQAAQRLVQGAQRLKPVKRLNQTVQRSKPVIQRLNQNVQPFKLQRAALWGMNEGKERTAQKRTFSERFEGNYRENFPWDERRQFQSGYGEQQKYSYRLSHVQEDRRYPRERMQEEKFYDRQEVWEGRFNNRQDVREGRFNDRQDVREGRFYDRQEVQEGRFYDRQEVHQDRYSVQGNRLNLQNERRLYDTEHPGAKRSRPALNALPAVNPPQWQHCAPLIVVWPITIQSLIEERPQVVLEDNFPTEYVRNEHGVAVFVTLPMCNGNQKKFCLSAASDQKRAKSDALDLIVKHSTVIKPSPAYLCGGRAPNFVRYNIPCQTNPRTYIILKKDDTGPLSSDKIHSILQTFQESYNEDVFFDNYSFSFQEKNMLIEIAPKYNLKVRHFGDAPGINNRWVCIYKKKGKEQILKEVMMMRGHHPKYTITTERLLPRQGFNSY